MTDLPTELRSLSKLDHSDVLGEKMRDAADEIERLRTQLDNIRELLPTAWTEGDCIDWEEERMTDYVVKTWHDANGTITAETVSHIDGEDVGAQEVVDLIREQQTEIERLRSENNAIAQQLMLTESQKHNVMADARRYRRTLDVMKFIGWYNPNTKRFCYYDEWDRYQETRNGYTLPVYVCEDVSREVG